MSTMETAGAADVLADLDELDSVMGVETQDQQDLKPKQVRFFSPNPGRRCAATVSAVLTCTVML